MPLLDHFHPPLLGHRHWEGFHGWWAAAIAGTLNDDLLPAEYFAEFQVTVATRVEVDVATFEDGASEALRSNGGSLAVQARVWTPPTPFAVVPAIFPDDFEVRIFNSAAGPTLVAAIELVSPGNKDRDDARRAFAAKCGAYLQRGIGLMVVDIVTSRHANLHDELTALWGHTVGFTFPGPTPLYATAYRPARRDQRNEIDLWLEPLAIGRPLPTLPLAVRSLGCLPIDLEGTYMEARKRGRVD
ncbi:MAG TPA: DUF4058 family protein [Pirellulales bacterium]|nr:DUF4058 family protein [Pirellulales bacterium]